MKARWAALAIVVVMAAGCLDPDRPPDGMNGTQTTGTTAPSMPQCTPQAGPVEPQRGDGFTGHAALDWVEAVVYEEPAVLRPRIPADGEATCTAAWLGRALAAPGWDVAFSNFTGAEYRELPKGSAQAWADACGQADREELNGTWFHNVYATRRADGDARMLLLGAHWDQKEDADSGGVVPGANDGASGMGLLLEFQRHIVAAGIDLPFHVAIAFFDGEDGFEDCHPLAGSIHFAQTMPVQVDRMILLDMVGDRAARFPRESNSVRADPGLVDLFWEVAPDHGLGENFVQQQKEVVDDHRPFIDVGVPAIDIIDFARPSGEGRSGFPPYWHTTEDTPDKLEAGMLEDMGRLLLDVLRDPRFVEGWPDAA